MSSPVQRPPQNGLGTTGMILGILSACLFWVPGLGFILALLSTIFGGVGLQKVRNGTADNRGAAITGLVLGVIALALVTIWWILFWSAFGASIGTSTGA